MSETNEIGNGAEHPPVKRQRTDPQLGEDPSFFIPNAVPNRGRGSSDEDTGHPGSLNVLSDDEDETPSRSRNKKNDLKNNSGAGSVDYESVRYKNALKTKYGINFEEDDEGEDENELHDQMDDSQNNVDDVSDSEFASHMAKQVLSKKTIDDVQVGEGNLSSKYGSKNQTNQKGDDDIKAYRKRMALLMSNTDGERIESLTGPRFNARSMTFRERGELTSGEKKDDVWAAELDEQYEEKNLKEIALDSDEEVDDDGKKIQRIQRVDTVASKMEQLAKKDALLHQSLTSGGTKVDEIGTLGKLLEYCVPNETLRSTLKRLTPSARVDMSSQSLTSLAKSRGIVIKKNMRRADREAAEKAMEELKKEMEAAQGPGSSTGLDGDSSLATEKQIFDEFSTALDAFLSTGNYDGLDLSYEDILALKEKLTK